MLVGDVVVAADVATEVEVEVSLVVVAAGNVDVDVEVTDVDAALQGQLANRERTLAIC